MSTNNVLHPANGDPIIVPSQDVVLGLYYMTRESVNVKGEGSCYSDMAEIDKAYECGHVSLQAKVSVRLTENVINSDTNELDEGTRRVETTVGRALIWDIIPIVRSRHTK